GGREVTTIDAGGTGAVVTINANPGETPVIDGFTIRNGFDGGVHTTGGPALIENNRITSNRYCGTPGGGVSALFSAATIRNNLISDNHELFCVGGFAGGI